MMKFRIVASPEEADADAIIVTLFLCPLRKVRAWMVGPIKMLRDGVAVPYIPPSLRMLGITVVARADRVAREEGLNVYIVDPDHLWDRLFDV